jgi:stage II sporulation protein AA (anti-sigma F factor antagonist)
MEYHFDISENRLRIGVPRELDHHCAAGLREEVDLLVQAYHIRYLIFDFADTEFMDSSGIGVLIGRSRNLGFCGGQVSAVNLNPRVERIFRLSGLQRMIRVLPKEEAEHEKLHDSFF